MTPNRDTGIGVRVERDQEITVGTILEIETDRDKKELEHCQMTEIDQDLGLGST